MKRRSFLRNTTLLTAGLSLLRSNKVFAAFKSSKSFFINEVIHLWSGAITPNTAKVNAKLAVASDNARIVASTNAALTNPIFGNYTNADASNNRMAAMSISGLVPNTKYYYAVESNGEIDNSPDAVGSFTTPPGLGGYSFKFTAASCSENSNHPIFTRIGEKNPHFHITTGDLHYANPNSSTDINVHRIPYENALAQTALKNLLLNVPIVYTWDDHDFCGNDSDASSAGKINARLAYQEYLPHFPLPAGTGNVPIYHSFTMGRIHFIVSDVRSERSGTSIMGSVQKLWFKNQCIYAKNNNLVIAWINPVSYGGNRADNWGGYATERTELADFFKANSIQNMFIICGDDHMIAIDNGNNHDFTTGVNNPFKYPVLQAAALNAPGSNKGGTYSHGTFLNPDATFGQYALIEVNDTGGNQINISFTGFRVSNAGIESTLVSYNFTRTIFNALPIKILSFTVKMADDGSKAILTWKTAEEEQCKEYIIENSTDGVNFNTLRIVPCQGNSGVNEYIAYDNNPDDNNFYRVKALEKNGEFVYSQIESLRFVTQPSVVIHSGFANNVDVIINSAKAASAIYLVYNALSMQVIKKEIKLQKGKNKFEIDTNGFSTGIYFFKLKVENGYNVTRKFIVN
ncbi:MAG: alkaline phosphatase D family protein [Chitinophagaceae bacterium]